MSSVCGAEQSGDDIGTRLKKIRLLLLLLLQQNCESKKRIKWKIKINKLLEVVSHVDGKLEDTFDWKYAFSVLTVV